MRNSFLYFFLIICSDLCAQNGAWTWISGSSTPNQSGNFGTKGVPAPTNQPPSLYESAEWTDLNGNFWLYGGSDGVISGYAGLWRYDVNTGIWTWMSGSSSFGIPGSYGVKGVPSPTNFPGSRLFAAASWIDTNGDLWLFGGTGMDPTTASLGLMNDLWRYNIATNEWTWMSGQSAIGSPGNFGTLQVPAPTNEPRSRSESAARWIDNSGNLWIFSGNHSPLDIDDMWRYDIATNQWTWMSGQSTGTVPPNHGTLGVSSPTNTPGGRYAYTNWVDKQGNFWLFGGASFISSNFFTDMWKYDPITNLWTWMAGSSTSFIQSTFTQKCVPGNGIPGSTWENRACWTDACGRFWMFGGADLGYTSLNTLWMFDPITLQFTWVSGSLASNPTGVFGTQNIPSTANIPPGLNGSNAFKSLNGDLWLFGGFDGSFNCYNTLWKYQIDSTCSPQSSSIFTVQPDTIGCLPFTAQFTALAPLSFTFYWDFGDASITADTSNLNSPNWLYNQAGNYTVMLIANGTCGIDTSSVLIRVGNPPSFDFGSDTTICVGQSILLNTSIVGTYNWNTGDTTASILVNTAGQFSIQITTDTFNCVVSDTVNIAITPLPVPNLDADTAICNGQTLLLNPGAFDSYLWNTGDTTATIITNAQGNYSVQVELNKCFNSDTISITVDELPLIGVGTDSIRCSIVLNAGNPGATYLWNTGETTQTITTLQAGTYFVTITNGACVVLDSITITGELGGGLLYIPNAFTPDDNGNNERFLPRGTNIEQFSMVIYNRWGNKVFETDDMSVGWDGRNNGNLVQEDVYVYVINYTNDCSGKKQIRKLGHVTVVR